MAKWLQRGQCEACASDLEYNEDLLLQLSLCHMTSILEYLVLSRFGTSEDIIR